MLFARFCLYKSNDTNDRARSTKRREQFDSDESAREKQKEIEEAFRFQQRAAIKYARVNVCDIPKRKQSQMFLTL